MPGTVLYHCDTASHVATITYNRPHRMNALNAECRADLNAAFVRFRDDEDAWPVGVCRSCCSRGALRQTDGGVEVRSNEHPSRLVPGRCAILTGKGRAFCAGADMKDGSNSGDASAGSFWEMPGLTSLENGLEIW